MLSTIKAIGTHFVSPFTFTNSHTKAFMSIKGNQLSTIALTLATGGVASAVFGTPAASMVVIGAFYSLTARSKWVKINELNAHQAFITTTTQLGKQRLIPQKSQQAFQNTLVDFSNKSLITGEAYFDIQEAAKTALMSSAPSEYFNACIDQMVQGCFVSWHQGELIKDSFDTLQSSETFWKSFMHFFKRSTEPLVKLYKQTKQACENGFLVGNTKVMLDPIKTKQMQEGTLIYKPQPITSSHQYSTTVNVYNGDTLDVTRQLQKRGLNPAVLNNANAVTPGGGVEHGSRAQEEDLFRRSNYHQGLYLEKNPSLKQQMPWFRGYRIPEFGVIYTPFVQVFRSSSNQGFAFHEPYSVDMIACAAYNLKPHANDAPGTPDSPAYINGFKEKIRATLRTAILTGHDAIVLGALGCGAFKNDSKQVANFFKDILKEKEFKNQFKEVAFAIIDDKNGTNYAPFKRVLHLLWI